MPPQRRPRVDTRDWPTRELILLEASRLFATRGYLGTSTRDIATAVGIQQPSMYSHFTSKHAIAEELLRRDLTAGIAALERFTAEAGGAGVELYRYLCWEVQHDLESPFDLRSLYLGALLEQPEFAEGRRLLKRYDGLVTSLIRRGSAAGEFIEVDPKFATRMIDGVIIEAIRSAAQGKRRLADEPAQIASFVVRALLARPARLDAVREKARRLDG